jgi:hypothetical protein
MVGPGVRDVRADRRAGEAAIGLAILVIYFRGRGTIAVDDINQMKGLRMIQLIVFLPLAGRHRRGLAARCIGTFAVQADHDWARCSCRAIFSWPIFVALHLRRSCRRLVTGARLDPFRRSGGRLGASGRCADRGDAGGGDDGLSLVHLYSWGYMAEDPSTAPLLRPICRCSPSRC